MFNQKKSKLMQTKGQLMKSLHTAFSFAPPSILSLTIYPIKQILFYFFFYPITLAPNGMKESLAILKNCFPNGIPTIVIHHIQPTIRFQRYFRCPNKVPVFPCLRNTPGSGTLCASGICHLAAPAHKCPPVLQSC